MRTPRPTPVPMPALRLFAAEALLRQAGRLLEAQTDPEWQRLGRIAFRLAQRVAIDGGRLKAAA